MDATELSKTLRESARSNGLCDQWYNEWKDSCSPKELAAKMFNPNRSLELCYYKISEKYANMCHYVTDPRLFLPLKNTP